MLFKEEKRRSEEEEIMTSSKHIFHDSLSIEGTGLRYFKDIITVHLMHIGEHSVV